MCEKPLAPNLAECDAMVAAAARRPSSSPSTTTTLLLLGTRKLRELIAEGTIGEVLAPRLAGLGLRPWVGNEAYRPGWRFLVDQRAAAR